MTSQAPWWTVGVLVAVLLVIGYGFVYFVVLQVAGAWLASRERRAEARRDRTASPSAPPTFYFLVPCRDEEAVIGETVRSLLAQDDESLVVVIDDASQDATAAIAASQDADRVLVLSRRLPNARLGKGKALNDGLRFVRRDVAERGLDPARVVVGVMDADGRLSPATTEHVGDLFDDARVGGVQLQVRIRNRDTFLTRVQDIGFWGTSAVAQMGRNATASVSLGGNGQFARLSALDEVPGEAWTDSLTEDLDLMITLTVRGWAMRQTSLAWVEQEAPTTLRALVTQRTRWAQGHMVCAARTGEVLRSPDVSQRTALELTCYLWQPWLLAIPWSVLAPSLVVLAVLRVGDVNAQHGVLVGLAAVLAWYVLAFVPVLWGSLVYARRASRYGFVRSFWMHQASFVLNLVTYAATWRALVRILTRRRGWAKTTHGEAVPAAAGGPPVAPS
ncbi:MAG TPA: glycosyltransferase family 2 protein [Luteimicrobium sp.]|nr:glycosyltransferase family 2 protein [Luteimicrobium sp.]